MCHVCVLVVFVCKYAYAKLHAVLNSVAGQQSDGSYGGVEGYGISRLRVTTHWNSGTHASRQRRNKGTCKQLELVAPSQLPPLSCLPSVASLSSLPQLPTQLQWQRHLPATIDDITTLCSVRSRYGFAFWHAELLIYYKLFTLSLSLSLESVQSNFAVLFFRDIRDKCCGGFCFLFSFAQVLKSLAK